MLWQAAVFSVPWIWWPPDPDAHEKSAFITCLGLWKWKVLPFGLTLALATIDYIGRPSYPL